MTWQYETKRNEERIGTMSKEFYVIVNEQSVIVKETKGLSVHHAKAIVDGEEYFYQVVKDTSNVMEVGGSKIKKSMFGRGINQVFYHAKNAGNIVRFIPIGRSSSKKKDVSDKQRSLF